MFDLGFLSTGDRNANGNQALLDLLAVLTWIKDNIASFDGDPNRVTLFGHGHGAALVNFLMLSHVVSADTDLKFHRAILQSGSAFSSWATSFDPVACAQKLAGNVNCSEHLNKSIDLIQCLKNKTANELVKNAPIPPKYFSCFAPTLDNAAFFSEDSIEKLISRKSGLFSKIKVMFGVTKNEAYAYLKQKELENGISEFRKSQIIRTYVQNVYKYHRQKIFEILDHQYSEWDRMQDDKTRRDNIMQLLSDGQYTAPLIEMALQHSRYSDSYLYSFGYSTQSESEEFPKWSSGIHGDELPYIFGAPLVDGVSPFPSKYKKNEKELSAFMMRMWTNFAKSGNPNYPMKTSPFEGSRYSGIEWPLYEKDRQMYLQIGRRTLSRDHYRGKQIALWTDLIPKINIEGSSQTIKPDSAEHNLIDPKNMSTFDEPNRLLTHFRRIGPPFKYVQPINDDIKSSSHISNKNTSTPRHWSSKITTDDEYGVSSTVVNSALELGSAENVTKNSVPLSITVAIGCTLLFFNILIFAGVYYQRERIKKLKSGNSRQDIDGINRTKQTDEKEIQGTKVHETITLIPSADNQQNKVPPSTLGGSDDILYNQVSLPHSRNEMLSDRYSYSPVPTSTSSPMHGHKHHQIVQSSLSQTPSPSSLKVTGEFKRRPPDSQTTSSNVTERSNNSKKVSKQNAMTVV
ncbi:hypothetical protein FSP39_021115 [Pinctada imbricata]|uniref:Carboxylesterase type B domain-containing protein n=1 Tax=Pinctada imbricata TaxID=66713 RepID=A0AA89BVF9_PINIB|nr:hypothetical protein FSP39_021115 [Pinctada imbricata]